MKMDPELQAIQRVTRILEPLGSMAADNVISYVAKRILDRRATDEREHFERIGAAVQAGARNGGDGLGRLQYAGPPVERDEANETVGNRR